MTEFLTRIIRCGLIGVLALAVLAGAASAQEGEEVAEHIQNVLLTFHLVQADGFTDEDPEISDVVSELREIFNFQGYRLLSTSVFNVGMMAGSSGRSTSGFGSQRIIPGDSATPLTVSATLSSRTSTGVVRAHVTLTDQTTRPTGEFRFGNERMPLLGATVSMRDGQGVILGSARRAAEEPVLILVVTPRIDP